MRIAVMMVAGCLVASPVSGFDGGWGERSPDPYADYWASEQPSTTRPPVNPYDYLPDGHEESVQHQYENQQYRSRYGSCANMYDNNPAAKEMCLKGLGR